MKNFRNPDAEDVPQEHPRDTEVELLRANDDLMANKIVETKPLNLDAETEGTTIMIPNIV